MRNENCIFCKIAVGDIPSATIYEDENFRGVLDMGPATFGHALLIPKDHFQDLMTLPDEICGKALVSARKIGKAMIEALPCDGFNIVQNNGEAAGQTVSHFHIHIIPRYKNGPRIVSWTPGTLSDEDKEIIVNKMCKSGL